jgi:hypothetical protein
MRASGLVAKCAAFARRRPFTAFMLVVVANAVFWAVVLSVIAAEYVYRDEVGWSDFAPPIGAALERYLGAQPDAPFTPEALVEGLKAHSDEYGRPGRKETAAGTVELAAGVIDDEYGRGIVLYYPGEMRGPFWRRRYAFGLIVYEGLRHGRFVRLYRFPDEKGFCPADVGEGRHGAWGLEPPSRTKEP